MEAWAAAIVLGILAQGGGLPSHDERLWAEHQIRICSHAGNTDPKADLRECIIQDMEKRKAKTLADINKGRWRPKR